MTEQQPTKDDASLVSRARAGDREAFAHLVVKYQNAAYAAAFARLRNVKKLAGEVGRDPSLAPVQLCCCRPVEITEKRGRLSFDKDRLAADHPEIDMKQYESRGKPTKALSVKER